MFLLCPFPAIRNVINYALTKKYFTIKTLKDSKIKIDLRLLHILRFYAIYFVWSFLLTFLISDWGREFWEIKLITATILGFYMEIIYLIVHYTHVNRLIFADLKRSYFYALFPILLLASIYYITKDLPSRVFYTEIENDVEVEKIKNAWYRDDFWILTILTIAPIIVAVVDNFISVW